MILVSRSIKKCRVLQSLVREENTAMKLMLTFAAILALSLAAPAPQTEVELVSSESENIGIDGYKFGYKLSDGTSREEVGELKNAGTDEAFVAVTGSVTWTAPDGQQFTMTFIADENGFQPQGDHIPK